MGISSWQYVDEIINNGEANVKLNLSIYTFDLQYLLQTIVGNWKNIHVP